MSDDPDDDEHHSPLSESGRTARISARLGSAVLEAAAAERAQSLFGTKLIAAGLALVAVAGGLDYFQHQKAIYQVLGDVANDAGQGDVVTTLQGVNQQVDALKLQALAHLPKGVRDHLAGAALALGAVLLTVGTRIKLRFARGQLVRDIGRVIAGPGFLGVVAFALISWRGVAVLRATTLTFTTRLREGQLSWSDLKAFTVQYGPWAWEPVGAVLLLGVLLLAASAAVRFAWVRRIKRAPLLGEVLQRSTFWGGVLAVSFYLAATVISIVSYGGALRLLAWPWKTNRGAFLVTLAFMALGLGLARTGTNMMKREAAEGDDPDAAPAPAA